MPQNREIKSVANGCLDAGLISAEVFVGLLFALSSPPESLPAIGITTALVIAATYYFNNL